jgi:hypothetical protein
LIQFKNNMVKNFYNSKFSSKYGAKFIQFKVYMVNFYMLQILHSNRGILFAFLKFLFLLGTQFSEDFNPLMPQGQIFELQVKNGGHTAVTLVIKQPKTG